MLLNSFKKSKLNSLHAKSRRERHITLLPQLPGFCPCWYDSISVNFRDPKIRKKGKTYRQSYFDMDFPFCLHACTSTYTCKTIYFCFLALYSGAIFYLPIDCSLRAFKKKSCLFLIFSLKSEN